MTLQNRIAAVSGAGGPMGRAVVDTLIARGIGGVALTDISGRRLDATVADLPPDLPVVAMRADVTEPEEVFTFSDAAHVAFGGIDMLVNLVGGIRSQTLYTPFMQITPEQWRSTLNLNLMGTITLSQAFAPHMVAQGWGRIVNVSSIVFGGEAEQADYAAAKAAVASLTRSMAAELAPAVTVNCIAPGLTRTSVTDNMPAGQRDRLIGKAFNQRMAEPEEVADAIAYFLTDRARFVTGEMLSVSGGIRPHL